MDVVYLVDGSSHVDSPTFERIKKLVKSSFGYYNISKQNSRIGLAQFGDDTQVILHPSEGTSKAIVDSFIKIFKRPGGSRRIDRALLTVRRVIFDKSDRNQKKVLILVTTGMNAKKGADMLPAEADLLKKQGVDTVVLSVGPLRNEKELNAIAKKVENVVKVAKPERLPESYGILERKINNAGSKCFS